MLATLYFSYKYIHMQDAERKAQDSSEEMHELAQTYVSLM